MFPHHHAPDKDTKSFHRVLDKNLKMENLKLIII